MASGLRRTRKSLDIVGRMPEDGDLHDRFTRPFEVARVAVVGDVDLLACA